MSEIISNNNNIILVTSEGRVLFDGATLDILDFESNPLTVDLSDDRAMRRWCCGSTDVPKIMGTCPYDGQYSLFHMKLNDEVVPMTPPMKMGILMEPVYRHLTQESLADLGLDPEDEVIEGKTFIKNDFMLTYRATPDALLRNNPDVCFEFKRRQYEMSKNYGEEMTDEVMPQEYDQVQWHMLLSGCKVCFVGVFFKGTDGLKWWRVERDEERIREIESEVLSFWSLLATGVVPPLDNTKGMLKRLKSIEERDASRRPFTDEEWGWAKLHHCIKQKIDVLDVEKKGLEVKLAASMGEMQEIYDETGRSKVTLKAPKNRKSRSLTPRMYDIDCACGE